jgi:hypothetical protein
MDEPEERLDPKCAVHVDEECRLWIDLRAWWRPPPGGRVECPYRWVAQFLPPGTQ